MHHALKQFEEKVTALRNNQFQLARLRLTGIYAVLLFTILLISSVITHSLFASRLEYRMRVRPLFPPDPVPQFDRGLALRTEAQEELVGSLYMVNGVLFATAIGLGYVLAGITLKPIQKSYNQQKRFLSDASHELRTPIAILQTNLENELSDAKSDSQKKQITSHLEEVKRMGTIVQDLLLLSRLDSEHSHTQHTEHVHVHDLLQTATDRLSSYAKKHQVTLTYTSESDSSITILGNKEHLLQAITNITKNAIEYSNTDGKVTIESARKDQHAIITITDTGSGIPQEDLSKIFDRFYRVDKSRSRSKGGSGLGLPIAKLIVEAHGGTISLTSALEHGTTATISLPISS